MYGNSMPNMPVMSSWIRADSYWHGTKASRSKRLEPDERSLVRDKQAKFSHYSLKRAPEAEYYDVRLYKHNSCRLFKTEPNGEYAVWYSNTGSITDRTFLWRQTPYNDKVQTTDGREVKVPLYLVPARLDKWSAKLVFSPNHRLIVDRSWHIPHYRSFMTDDKRAERKQITKLAEPFVNMAVLAMDELDTYDLTVSAYGRLDYDWLYHSDIKESSLNLFMSRARALVKNWKRRNSTWVSGTFREDDMPPKLLRKLLLEDIMTNLYMNGRDGQEDKPMFMNYDDWSPTLRPRRVA